MIHTSLNNYRIAPVNYNNYRVAYDCTELSAWDEVLATALMVESHAVQHRSKYIISNRPWIWFDNPSIDGCYNNHECLYPVVGNKMCRLVALHSPYEVSTYSSGQRHLINAWGHIAGVRPRLGPVIQQSMDEKTEVVYDVSSEKLRDKFKERGWRCIDVREAQDTWEELRKAAVVITDSSRDTHKMSTALDIPTLMIWIDQNYTRLSYPNQTNMYISNCATPLCRLPHPKWKAACKYADACGADYRANTEWLSKKADEFVECNLI